MIQYKGAKIQLLDLPGIIEGAKDGKGRGRQVRNPIPLLLAYLCRYSSFSFAAKFQQTLTAVFSDSL